MDYQYLALLRDVKENGIFENDRTGVGTFSVFGRMYRHDLSLGFPVLTTKKLHLKSIIHELLWFLKGDTNIAYLKNNGVSIWDEWATETGDLGPVYGAQWRMWEGKSGEIFDQVNAVISSIKRRPNSRRHIINAWNVALLPDEEISPEDNARNGKMALPPCHVMYQFYVKKGKLSCMLTQRSGDLFLGIPFNAVSVSLLTHIIAQQCDLEVGEIIHSIGDLHLYGNHIEQAKLQLTREPRKLPSLKILRKPDSIDHYRFEDFEIVGYDPHPHIKASIAK